VRLGSLRASRLSVNARKIKSDSMRAFGACMARSESNLVIFRSIILRFFIFEILVLIKVVVIELILKVVVIILTLVIIAVVGHIIGGRRV
jgi:hypothetical protein